MDVYLIWFLIGIAFFIIEMSMPTFILFFFGIGAWVVSITLGLFCPSISLNQQIILFTSSSIISLLFFRNYLKNIFLGEQRKRDFENSKLENNNKIAIVTKTIRPKEFGEIKYKGTYYKSTSNTEINKGENVEVVDKGDSQGSYYNVKKIK